MISQEAMGERIRKAVHALCEMHSLVGAAFIRVEDASVKPKCKNVLQEGFELRVSGRLLSPKAVRRWLFERRRHPAMEKDPVVWSAYDPESGDSVVGLAIVAEPATV